MPVAATALVRHWAKWVAAVCLCVSVYSHPSVTASEYHRGPWPVNPACAEKVRLDEPGQQRGAPLHQCGAGNMCSEYAYFNATRSAEACAETCCGDWSCWGFTFYPLGRRGNNSEPLGPGHSCDGKHTPTPSAGGLCDANHAHPAPPPPLAAPFCVALCMPYHTPPRLTLALPPTPITVTRACRNDAVLRAAERHARRRGGLELPQHPERCARQAPRTVEPFLRTQHGHYQRLVRWYVRVT